MSLNCWTTLFDVRPLHRSFLIEHQVKCVQFCKIILWSNESTFYLIGSAEKIYAPATKRSIHTYNIKSFNHVGCNMLAMGVVLMKWQHSSSMFGRMDQYNYSIRTINVQPVNETKFDLLYYSYMYVLASKLYLLHFRSYDT